MTPEGKLKKDCRDIAKKRKLIFWNIDGKGINGVPDTVVGLMGRRGVAFVEFKREDGKGVISVQQHRRHDDLISAGAEAHFVSSIGEYLDIIEGRTL